MASISGATLLANVPHSGSLDASAAYPGSGTITIPPTTPAGTYYLVLSGCSAGAATIHFQHLPAGNGPTVRITPGVEAHTHEFVQTGQDDSKFGFGVASGAAAVVKTMSQAR